MKLVWKIQVKCLRARSVSYFQLVGQHKVKSASPGWEGSKNPHSQRSEDYYKVRLETHCLIGSILCFLLGNSQCGRGWKPEVHGWNWLSTVLYSFTVGPSSCPLWLMFLKSNKHLNQTYTVVLIPLTSAYINSVKYLLGEQKQDLLFGVMVDRQVDRLQYTYYL